MYFFQVMQELFADKPWIKPVSVAGSHLNLETKEKENILQEGSKIKRERICLIYKSRINIVVFLL